ncbi:MAG: anaerobic sulfatase maturase [Verrucomicrobiota bacterium]
MALNKPFSLLIKPAGPDCNLQCEYCFYRSRLALFPATTVHRMTIPMLEKLISSYMATSQPVYAFAWQGGEPLLMGLEFFQQVTHLQARYGRTGAAVQNSLQTNGALITDKLAEHFASYHFLAGISLDGPPSIHDRYRVNSAGDGSFSAVWRGIECLRRHNVDFNILTLVTQANIRRAAEVYRYLCDEGFMFQQYIPCVETDARGKVLPFSIDGESWGEFLCRMYDLWIKHDTRRVSVRLFDSILNLMVDQRYTDCQIRLACDTYFVVEHNGDVYPCDFFVEPRWRLGNIGNLSWHGLRVLPLYRQFSRRKGNHNEACKACKWRRFCQGDCPKFRLSTENDTRQISHLCQGWQMFYEHTYAGFKQLADQIRRERPTCATR